VQKRIENGEDETGYLLKLIEKAIDSTITVDQNYFRHNGTNIRYSPSAKYLTEDLNHTWRLELIGNYQSEQNKI